MIPGSQDANGAEELAVFRDHLQRYRAVTLQTLDLLSPEQLVWRPNDEARSFAEELVHLAQTESFYTHGLLAGDWLIGRMRVLPTVHTHASVEKLLEDTRAHTLTLLADLDTARLSEIVNVPVSPMAWTLRSWLWYLVEHEVHHKAVLAGRLRQLGLTPPYFAFALPVDVRPDVEMKERYTLT
jgi:uncharacterized damage-inducible protein DinB